MADARSYVLVLEMLQQLELTVCTLGEHWRAERLHNLLDRHCLPGELILRRTVPGQTNTFHHCPEAALCLPDEPEGSHTDRLQVGISSSNQ